MALLLHPGPVPQESLREALGMHAAGETRIWPEVGDPAAIEYALVSRIPAGELRRFPRLRLVGSLHSGVDHLLEAVPAGVPITRPVPSNGDVLMNEYVLAQVMALHRQLPAYARAQRTTRWHKLPALPAARRTVGILGYGAMAAPAAQLLLTVGFDVAAWARRPRTDAPIPVFHGEDGLAGLLSRSQIVVNLLPLTPETANLLDARRFAAPPRGAGFINVGRGEHVVEADLLAALDSGQLAAAVLDVFRQEPLPPESPLWHHPGVVVTPHACRQVDVAEVVAQFVEDMRRVRDGLPPLRAIDRAAGY